MKENLTSAAGKAGDLTYTGGQEGYKATGHDYIKTNGGSTGSTDPLIMPPESYGQNGYDESWIKKFEKEFANHGFIPEEKQRFLSFIQQEIDKAREEKAKLYQEQGIENGVRNERQKIIKLLEGMKPKDLDPLHSYMPHVKYSLIDEAIKLISNDH